MQAARVINYNMIARLRVFSLFQTGRAFRPKKTLKLIWSPPSQIYCCGRARREIDFTPYSCKWWLACQSPQLPAEGAGDTKASRGGRRTGWRRGRGYLVIKEGRWGGGGLVEKCGEWKRNNESKYINKERLGVKYVLLQTCRSELMRTPERCLFICRGSCVSTRLPAGDWEAINYLSVNHQSAPPATAHHKLTRNLKHK